ncbi:hypothetical protein [Brumimicrobium mesophilum]|uniref:hypothetical protein n=1 Tax=Brumimicrobium mesophilum TaxID=392717 RepID=UPI000D140FE3|nr:hypothetical protein [Brumimicrobium mesophilum]
MKNLIITSFTAFLMFAFSPTATAQEVGYEKGKTYFDIGIGAPRFGFGNSYLYNNSGYNSYRVPVLRANVEIGFNELFSGGLYAGYSHYGYRWTNALGDWDTKYSFITAGFRGTFHIWDFINENLDLGLGYEEFDLYASLMIGAQINSFSDKTPVNRTTNRSTKAFFGITTGAKYYFTNKVAVFIEGGYGASSYGLIGLTFKL